MIWRPKTGQKIITRYRKSQRHFMPHMMPGVVVLSGSGKGPINALINNGNELMVIPRGNLFLQEGRS